VTAPESLIDYRPFLELSPEMACVLGLDGRVLEGNAAWEALLGSAVAEMRGRAFVDLAFERDRGRVAAALARLAAGKPVTDAQHRFLHHDGSFRWLSWSAKSRPEEGLIFASAREVGVVSLRHLKAIAEGTTDFVGVAELTGEVMYMNPAGMAMVGRAGQSGVGLRMSDVRTEKGARHSAEEIRPAALRDGIWSGETEFRGPGGKTVATWQVIFPLRDEDGAPEAFGCIARDIGERRQRELELRRFKTIVDSASDFVAIASPSGTLRHINAAGLALIGHSAEEARSLRLQDVFTAESAARFEKDIRAALTAGRSWSGEPDLLCADGSAIPTASVVLMLRDQDDGHAEIAIVSRDLSSHRRADALQTALRAMSTPILEVWDGVLALPVIGVVDSARASEMTEALLHAIVRARCRVAILDLTGVDVMDTSTLGHLFKMVSAASLLGSACVVSGISAHIAQTIAMLGLDLSSVRAFRTLQDALSFALQKGSGQSRSMPVRG
jgi:rsbT co-antagonist protein RsbR